MIAAANVAGNFKKQRLDRMAAGYFAVRQIEKARACPIDETAIGWRRLAMPARHQTTLEQRWPPVTMVTFCGL
jgi:hypothetical protein